MIDKKKLTDALNGSKEQNQKAQEQKVQMPQMPSDPNLTLEVKNPEVEEWMKIYALEKTGDNLNQLIEKLRLSRLLVPAVLNDKKQPVPCLLKSSTEEMLFPVYTCKEQIPPEPKSPVLINMPFLAINQMVAKPETKAAGIVLNPFSNNLVFKMPLVQKIEEVEKRRQSGAQKKTMQLTPEQYMMFERKQFESGFLPKRFFEQGAQMMEELCEKKEEYIDQLFEEAYQQKRMYPYLPEDFSVMVMNISEELLLVRVDLPNKDMGVNACSRVYLAWNTVADKGRYFTIERTKEKGVQLLGEIGSDWKHIDHGQSPVEGAELQRVLDIIADSGN